MNTLTTLKEAYRILNLDEGDEYRYNVGILLKEAIEELELLSNSLQLTCEGCKYHKELVKRKDETICCTLDMDCIRKYKPKDRWENRE